MSVMWKVFYKQRLNTRILPENHLSESKLNGLEKPFTFAN